VTSPRTEGASMRVLVVEDQPLNRILLRDLLRHAGHSVVEAGTVDEALDQLRAQVPDLVLTDLQLPGRGGQSLLDEIKRRPDWAGLPVVAVTAFAMRGDRERILALGFHGYVTKPIDTRRFVADIESIVRAHGSKAPG
jgi:CheY-like chemotaxis protein